MNLSERDRRAVLLLAIAGAIMLLWRFVLVRDETTTAEASVGSAEIAEKQLARLRSIAATIPAREKAAKQATEQLLLREKGMIPGDTAEQAKAQLLQIVRRVGKNETIDARGGEFGPVRPLGDHYGEVSVATTFECTIEQLVNFLAALTAENELIATSEIQISTANAKEKRLRVRVVLAGVVDRKLVPRQKGAAS